MKTQELNISGEICNYSESGMIQMLLWGVTQGQRVKVDFSRNLTIDEQDTFLSELFGDEFYEKKGNKQFDFSTLPVIFAYIAYRSKQEGYINAESDIRKALGIFKKNYTQSC